ncbi:MAG TPA: amidinotransferase [Thermoanaerobaculia bacterium]|nr:amidinotransferase [Thermoanaerobaculia bacterium]
MPLDTAIDDTVPAVCSYNEWDPLEEVVVGVIDGAAVPPWSAELEVTMPLDQKPFYLDRAGRPFPAERIAAARRDLEELVHILEAEGVTVTRPEPLDFTRRYATPEWESTGLYAAMPRDLLLVVGDEIIECPLAWRSRHFEVHAYRPLLKEYFRRGARWTSAPSPQLSDELYNLPPEDPDSAETFDSILTEYEPTFDAADFIRCGRDLFVQRSHVTNAFGIEWLRRHLGDAYRIHEVEVSDVHPMHIDATLMPLAPGKVLINPERIKKLPDQFHGWEVLEAPRPAFSIDHPLYMSSRWLSMNIVMLDEERVMVERQEEELARKLRDWGMKPIPCTFTNFYAFGGSFHCATLDVRRRGELKSYF